MMRIDAGFADTAYARACEGYTDDAYQSASLMWQTAPLSASLYQDEAVTRNYPVRRETGKEQMVEVRHDEGVANRIGQLSSHERYISRVPTALGSRKATRTGASSRVLVRPGVVADSGMCGRSLFGNREISQSGDGRGGGSVRGGKARCQSRR